MAGPYSAEVEGSLVGAMLAHPRVVGEVVGTLLEPAHFHLPAFQTLYAATVSAYYAEEPIDPLTIGELCSKRLSAVWRCDEQTAVEKVQALAARTNGHSETVGWARLVKRDFDYRELLSLAQGVVADIGSEERSPEELAGLVAQRATQIATSSLLTHELVDFEQLGRNYIQHLRGLRAMRAAGLDVGVRFGHEFMDVWTRGLRPSYVYFLAGEQGVGKSALAWALAVRFGERQLKKPVDKQIGTLVLSLEMTEDVSSTRVAQNITGLDGGDLQEGTLDEQQLAEVIEAWRPRRKMPLWFNFSPAVRASQLRALIAEAIRRHNVGFVVIDHMRYFHMDDRRGYRSAADEDEAKAEFLHEAIAKDLGVAVMCLAHTTKAIDDTDDRRPRLTHLRGGGMVSAHADFVAFLYQPYAHASQKQIEEGKVSRTEHELIYAKNRHSLTGTAHLHLDPSVMAVRDRIPV